MNLLRLYSIYDQGVNSFLRPFWSDHKANAIRSFQKMINDESQPDNMVRDHPDQFTLFEIGIFDSSNGLFTSHEMPLTCGKALEYVIPKV